MVMPMELAMQFWSGPVLLNNLQRLSRDNTSDAKKLMATPAEVIDNVCFAWKG